MSKYADSCPMCGAPMKLSTRDRNGNVNLPVSLCTNPRCGTAHVWPRG